MSFQVCQHRNPIGIVHCNICSNKKKNNFNHNKYKSEANIPHKYKSEANVPQEYKNQNSFTNQFTKFSGYINPNNTKPFYPNIIKRSRIGIGRDDTKRANYENDLFMKRSLENFQFMQNNNKQNIWTNPISDGSFPKTHIHNPFMESIHKGVGTRQIRKINDYGSNNDLHLKRSLIQPDYRMGNRFMEYKPSDTRNSNKNIGNQYANKYQQQSNELFGNRVITSELPVNTLNNYL